MKIVDLEACRSAIFTSLGPETSQLSFGSSKVIGATDLDALYLVKRSANIIPSE